MARFEREALAVAALSHPNILSIFDFGTQGGIAYAVTELLEGETLRAKLAAGPIPLGQALSYALQIAKGIAAAHKKGVVHRDLKPDNLFILADGHLKILDFGLAKRSGLYGRGTGAALLSDLTEPGTVMGTAGYMSPEQVRGYSVDHRADIFAFGTILYELLSGRRAFKKDTPADTMAAILNEAPADLSASGGTFRRLSTASSGVVSRSHRSSASRPPRRSSSPWSRRPFPPPRAWSGPRRRRPWPARRPLSRSGRLPRPPPGAALPRPSAARSPSSSAAARSSNPRLTSSASMPRTRREFSGASARRASGLRAASTGP